MKKDYPFILMLCGLLSCCIGYGIWRYLPESAGDNFFFIMLSFGFSFYTFSLRITYKDKYKNAIPADIRSAWIKYLVSDFGFNLAGTKLITELLLDGAKVHVYEYWNLAICFVVLIVRVWGNR